MATIKKSNLVIIILFLFETDCVLAKDFGKYGSVFAIKEEGFMAMVQRKLQQVDIEYHYRKMIEIAKERVTNPWPIIGISRAAKVREFYYDPTYILAEDIVLPCGKILHKAGASVNPLDHMDLSRRLIFVDGRDQLQVTWLKNQILNISTNSEDNNIEDRVILVGGKILDLQEELGTLLYFDQAGELTSKFGIKFMPAIVEQEGKSLKVTEIFIEE
ncbi:conjugal transfer protein TraW [Candidatus Tisiphia endosymbiont of Nemotelus uliginosus]|uniref:conjugal transfer protein TraW n=1 Tax=Candidatus Tisiphia endosymbiont of Nemotelus uliginosus TaxID=3077926 RepID=UPI0035C891A4